MARQASASESGKRATRKPVQGRQRSGSRADKSSSDESSRIIDSRHRRDIAGVVFILIAVVLMLIVVLPTTDSSTGLVTNVAGEVLHLVFGVGCYILPFFLAAVGVTFIIRFERERVPSRAVIGLTVIFIALLGFISMFTPVTNVGGQNLNLLFEENALITYGGYVGAGIAWVGLAIFGQIISCVILVGLMIVGVIIVGFSISSLIEKIRSNHATHQQAKNAAGSVGDDAPAFARVQRVRDDYAAGTSDADVDNLYPADAQTGVLVNPAHPLATPNATFVFQDRSKPTKRRRSSTLTVMTSQPTEALTQQLEPLHIPTSDQDAQDFVSQSELPLQTGAMTRKLGKQSDTEKRVETETNSARGTQNTMVIETAVPDPQEGFVLPPMSLLAAHTKGSLGHTSQTELDETAAQLQGALEEFGIMASVVDGIPGPTVTLFLVDLPPGVRVSRVTALNDDIALALAAPGVRIFAPVPGTNYVGIEVPNRERQTVLLSDVLSSAPPGPLQIAIGKDVEGHNIVSDLSQMPHLLIGGTTGSGKSVSINAMIMSILMRATPSEVRFIMIDPKRVEFTLYNGIPHLYVPVVTEAREAASALAWGVAEMERRLKVYQKAAVRNIDQFNAKAKAAREEDKRHADDPSYESKWTFGGQMPYIVIVIDELADLMMNVGKEVEASISRIAQLARAAGIHLIVATQRPSTNVVTGLIKANITNRIAFNVASSIDSRVILDTPGAENLIGLGDMLFSKPEFAKPQRIQGCYVSEEEISSVVSFLKEQGEPEYHSEILSTNLITLGSSSPDPTSGGSDDDPLLWEAADIVVSSGFGSTSSIQRRLKVGYSRAGRIMDQLEEKGIVGPANGSKPREVLVDVLELETLKAFESNDEDEVSSYVEE